MNASQKTLLSDSQDTGLVAALSQHRLYGQIAGWGESLPDRILTNDDLASEFAVPARHIYDGTGITARHIDGSASELALGAGIMAMRSAGALPDQLEFIIVATSSPNRLAPSVAAYVAQALGARCGTFDINAACYGSAHALLVGYLLLGLGMTSILVIGSDAMSTMVHPNDLGTRSIFGDGAGALLLTRCTDGDSGLLSWHTSLVPGTLDMIGTDSSGYVVQHASLFRPACRASVESCEIALCRARISIHLVDAFIPPQTNLKIVEAIVKRLQFPTQKVVERVSELGNTSAAGLPLAIGSHLEASRGSCTTILLSSFGAGLGLCSLLLRTQVPVRLDDQT